MLDRAPVVALAIAILSASCTPAPSVRPTTPGMSQVLADAFVENYRVEHKKRTGSFAGCDRGQVQLEHRGEMGAGFHEYEIVGCGDLRWRVFTRCERPDSCTDNFNGYTLERSARFDLSCEDGELAFTAHGGSAFGVTGCGKKATYSAGLDAWELAGTVADTTTKSVATANVSPAAEPTGSTTDAAFISATPQGSARAFVVGIERYRDLPAPTGARRDAERMAAMLRTTMGITGERLRVALDDRATAADIRRGLKWLADTTPAGGRAYFYFSGHGAPMPSTGSTYLVPFDGDPLSLSESALPLANVIADLGAMAAKEKIAMIDSCFSGSGGRSVLPKGTRPLVRIREPKATGGLVVITAATGAETSGTRADDEQGLFTSYLLQALGEGKADIDGDAQITVDEVLSWIKPRVARQAAEAGRQQTPRLLEGSADDGLVLLHGLPH